MAAIGAIPPDALGGFTVLGDLGLDGSIAPVAGVRPTAIGANSRDEGLICSAARGSGAALGEPRHPDHRGATGAPVADFERVTTRQGLADAIHQSFEGCFAEPRVSGPMPPGTVVAHLIFLISQRLSLPAQPRIQ
jgi:hypothetical protein